MKKVLLGVLIAIIVVILGASAWLYTGKFNPAKAKVFKALSLPVALVKGSFIGSHEFLNRVELAQLLAQSDPSFNSADTQGQILDQLIATAKLEIVAKSHNVTASQADIDDEYKAVVGQFAGGDEGKFTDMLNQAYHLMPDQFKAKVVQPDVLKTNLTIWFNQQQNLNQDAYNKQKDLLAKLDQGQAFDDVVKAYTQDEATKDFGGDAGFIRLSQLSPEFRTALTNAKAGGRVNIVSRYGLHIVQVVDVDKTGSEPSYHIKQLYIKESDFDAWYNQQAGKISSHKLIKL